MESRSDDVDANAEECLVQRRDELVDRLAAIESGAISAASGIGFGKRIGEGTNIAVERFSAVSMHDSLRAELKTVRRALERLEQGNEPGRCDVCGGPIGAARLEALPWAVHCVDCAL